MHVDFPIVPGPPSHNPLHARGRSSKPFVLQRAQAPTGEARPPLCDDVLERVLTAWAELQDEAWRNAVFGAAPRGGSHEPDRDAGRPIVRALCAMRAMSSTVRRGVTHPSLSVWQDLVHGNGGKYALAGSLAAAPGRNALLDQLLSGSRTLQVDGAMRDDGSFLGYVGALEVKPQNIMCRALYLHDLIELQRGWPAVKSLRAQYLDGMLSPSYEQTGPVLKALFASDWIAGLRELQCDWLACFFLQDVLPVSRVFAHLTSVSFDPAESANFLQFGHQVGRALPNLQDLRLKWYSARTPSFLHDLLPQVRPLRLLELQLNAAPGAEDFSFLRTANVQTLRLDRVNLLRFSEAMQRDVGHAEHLWLTPIARSGVPSSLYSLGNAAVLPWWQKMAQLVSRSDRLRDLTVYDVQTNRLGAAADLEIERDLHPGWPLFCAMFREPLEAAAQFEALYYAPGCRQGFLFA